MYVTLGDPILSELAHRINMRQGESRDIPSAVALGQAMAVPWHPIQRGTGPETTKSACKTHHFRCFPRFWTLLNIARTRTAKDVVSRAPHLGGFLLKHLLQSQSKPD